MRSKWLGALINTYYSAKDGETLNNLLWIINALRKSKKEPTLDHKKSIVILYYGFR